MVWKFDPAKRARLESSERLALLPIDRVLELTQPGPGERVLDVGCGTGVFTAPLTVAVGPSGHVHAVDLEPDMVEACRERIASLGLANVAVSLSEESMIPLPSASFELVFACQLFHELHDPPAFLAEIRRLLRPGGRLVAIEWEKVDTGIGPPVEKRFAPDESEALLVSNGFTVTARHRVTWANYLLLARPAWSTAGR